MQWRSGPIDIAALPIQLIKSVYSVRAQNDALVYVITFLIIFKMRV